MACEVSQLSAKHCLNLTLAVVLFAQSALGSAAAKAPELPKAEKQRPPRTDRYGDPLPEGAIARIGTTRFRINSSVRSVCYSPDGKILAAIGEGGVRLWNAATGKELQSYDQSTSSKDEPFPRSGFERGFFAPDGRRLWLQSLSAGQNSPGKQIYFLDVHPGSQSAARKAPFAGNDLHLLAPSPDGKFLALSDKSSIRICKIGTEEENQRLKTSCYQAHYSTDGKMLVCNDGRAITFWNPQTGKQIRSIPATSRSGHFIDFALSADGKTMVVLCRNGQDSIHLYDALIGKERRAIQVVDSPFRDMTISPDSKVLVVASQLALRAWNISSGKLLWEHRENRNSFHSVAFAPDSKTLAAGLGVEVRQYDAATGKQRPPALEGTKSASVGPLGDGRNVSTTDPEGRLRFWRFEDAEEIVPAPGWKPPVVPILAALSTDRRWMASRDHAGGDYRIWDLASGKEIHRFPFGKSSGCSFTPDGRWLQIHDYVQNPSNHKFEHELRFWDLRTGLMVSELKGDRASVQVFSPDSRLYATGVSSGRLCYLASVPNGSVLRAIPVRGGPWRFSFSADSRLLAGASLREVPPRIWEVATGKEITTLVGLVKTRRSSSWPGALEAVFSPDGRKLITGYYDGDLYGWDIEGRLLRQWKGDDFDINYLRFSPDGKLLLTGGSFTAVVWSMEEVFPPEKQPTTNLTEKDFESLWSDLKAEDATQAWRAIWKLEAAQVQAVPFLRDRLHPAREADKTNAEKIVKSIGDLDNNAFSVREKASRELATFGKEAEAALRKALAGNPSAESKRRIEELLQKMPESPPVPPPEQLQQMRALAVLEYAATPQAKKCLQTLAGGVPEARLTREATAVLERLTRRSLTAP